MRPPLFRIALATVLCTIGVAAGAQQAVYRCGSNYGQKPCEGAATIDVEDARTAEQKAAADALTQQNLARAKEMEKTRLAQEAREQADIRKVQKKTEKPRKTEKPKNKKKTSKSKKEPQYFTATEQRHMPKKSTQP
jgi:hypothetical protein